MRHIIQSSTLLILIVVFVSCAPMTILAPEIKIEITKERLGRGKYLVENVTGCIGCHSTRDWDYYAGPIISGTEGSGNELVLDGVGTLWAPNITPSGIGDWTDGELMRAITSGRNKNGDILFPMMPYPNYNTMSNEDIYSIVSYVRSLKPITSEPKENSYNFPLNLLGSLFIRSYSKPAQPQIRPSVSDTVAYGKYVINAAGCIDCHSPRGMSGFVEGKEYSGGVDFPLPTGVIVRSANITPDSSSGIGKWTKEEFISRFKRFASADAKEIVKGKYNTEMPWIEYAGMTEEDLGAIFFYLRTLKPVKNSFEKYKERE